MCQRNWSAAIGPNWPAGPYALFKNNLVSFYIEVIQAHWPKSYLVYIGFSSEWIVWKIKNLQRGPLKCPSSKWPTLHSRNTLELRVFLCNAAEEETCPGSWFLTMEIEKPNHFFSRKWSLKNAAWKSRRGDSSLHPNTPYAFLHKHATQIDPKYMNLSHISCWKWRPYVIFKNEDQIIFAFMEIETKENEISISTHHL